MRNRIAYILFLLPFCLQNCSDELSSIQKDTFIKFYGSFQNDAGMDVESLPSGGYAITGSIVSDSIPQMMLIRTDDAGNQVEGSPTVYGGDYKTTGRCILVLDDGFLLGGTLTDTTEDGELHTDMFLVRTDAGGREVWSRTFGNGERDVLNHIVRRHTGGFVLAGIKTTNEDEDLWILMVDEDGNPIFDFIGAARDDDDQANMLIRTENGYLCGCSYDDGALDGSDFYVVSLDESCNIVDTRVMGTEFDDYVRNIVRFGDGYLLMGNTTNEDDDGIGTLYEVSLYTFSLDGGIISSVDKVATISDDEADITGEDCVINSKHEIVLFGTSVSADNSDMWLFRLGSDGIVVDDDNNPVIFGQAGDQTGKALDNTYDGGLIMTGSNNVGGNSVISLIKTNAAGGL